MILPGRLAIAQKIIQNLHSPLIQTQPCGVDLTLKRILTFQSPGSIDFTNEKRKTATTDEIMFQSSPSHPGSSFIDLPGIPSSAYLLEFNETVTMPLDIMGQIYIRSSLFRSGALIHAGVMDAGYAGAVGACLQVVNPHGIRLWKDARVAQMVFMRMSEKTEGYSGVYQGSRSM